MKTRRILTRPLISTGNSTVRLLSEFLSNTLSPLIDEYVNAHLCSTSHFIKAVSDYIITPGCIFGSLYVTKLYGSITLEDDPLTNMSGFVSIVSIFYDTHRDSSSSPSMDKADLAELLRLVLFGDTYFFRGQHLEQVKGIVMGNCAAPSFAITDEVERRIKDKCPSLIFWKCYIDNVFLSFVHPPKCCFTLLIQSTQTSSLRWRSW